MVIAAHEAHEEGRPVRRRIRVMIAEDQADVRSVLADLVASDVTLELVGAARDADEAVALAGETHPDVALLDVKMPAGGGPRAANDIRLSSPGTHMIALSAYEDRETVMEMLQAGAVGYLVKGTPIADILEAIHRAVRGEGTLSAQVTTDVVLELGGELERKRREAEAFEAKVARVRSLIDQGGPTLVFQPICELSSGNVAGAEVLSRFTERPPPVWFEEAADVGLDVDLDRLVLVGALERLSQLPPGSYLSVNLSPATATSPVVLEILREAPAERIVVEVTEHAAVEDYEALTRALSGFRSRGGRLAIDDAGAGFASLRHVLALQPEIIKLDVSLTRGIDADPAKQALAAALISFAHHIDAKLVAEGIETPDELRMLRDLGVDLGQGYLLARPGPLPLEGSAPTIP